LIKYIYITFYYLQKKSSLTYNSKISKPCHFHPILITIIPIIYLLILTILIPTTQIINIRISIASIIKDPTHFILTPKTPIAKVSIPMVFTPPLTTPIVSIPQKMLSMIPSPTLLHIHIHNHNHIHSHTQITTMYLTTLRYVRTLPQFMILTTKSAIPVTITVMTNNLTIP
jgi:hypothetical protein